MNIKEQEYVLELDKYRSITQAAESLNITQPTLSIFLSNLEKRLGTPLFERVGKKLVPTQVGIAYVNRARQIAALKSDFDLEMADLVMGLRGELRIGGLQKRNQFLMPRLLRQLKETFPAVDVLIFSDQASNLIKALSVGKLDMIYINRNIPYPGLHSETIRNDHLLLAISPDHPANNHAVRLNDHMLPYLDLKHLDQETFFLMDEEHAIRFMADDAIRYCGAHPRREAPIDTIDLGCQLAAEGLGAAFTLESYAKDFIYPRPLKYYLTGDLEHVVTWRLMWRETTVISSFMEEFIRLLKLMA